MFSSGADEVVDLLASCPEIAILSVPFVEIPDPLSLEEEPQPLIASLGPFRISVGERQQDVSAMFRLFAFGRELDTSINLPHRRGGPAATGSWSVSWARCDYSVLIAGEVPSENICQTLFVPEIGGSAQVHEPIDVLG